MPMQTAKKTVTCACFACRVVFRPEDYIAGETDKGETVYHVLHEREHTVMAHWFTLDPDAIFTPGRYHPAQFDRRDAASVSFR